LCNLKNVVGSVAEAECSGVYNNAQLALPMRVALEELGHPQPKTPLKTDNSTAAGFANKSMRQKRSKSWDMRLNWLRDRIAQMQFQIFWDEGKNNQGDYPTKHWPPSHHIVTRPKYIMNNYMVTQNVLKDTIQNVLARVCCSLSQPIG
jgi:hypothetical protein